MSTVGQRIREYRQKAGKSQVELAKAIGVSKQTLYKYENDKVNGHFDKMVHTKVHTNKKRPRKNRAFNMPATGIEPVLPDSPETP